MANLVFAEVNVGSLPVRHRKRHTKSRNGCEQCKTKRIKCDEKLPFCGSCLRKGIACQRLNAASRESHSEEESPKRKSKEQTPSSPPPLPALTNVSVDGKLNILQLKLLHNFENYTAPTLVLFPVLSEVLELAFQYEYLMHAILMLSASHILSINHNVENSQMYHEAAFMHMTAASAGLRVALESINDGNASALFATSLLIYNQAWFCGPRNLTEHVLADQNSGPEPQNQHQTNQQTRQGSEESDGEDDVDFMVPLGFGIKQMIMEERVFQVMTMSNIWFGVLARYSPKQVLLDYVTEQGMEPEIYAYSKTLSTAFSTRHRKSASFELCLFEFERLKPVYFALYLIKQRRLSLDADPGMDMALARYLFTWPVMLSKDFQRLAELQDAGARAVLFYYYSAIRMAMETEVDGNAVRERYWWAKHRVRTGLPVLGRRLRREGVEAVDLVDLETCLGQLLEVGI